MISLLGPLVIIALHLAGWVVAAPTSHTYRPGGLHHRSSLLFRPPGLHHRSSLLFRPPGLHHRSLEVLSLRQDDPQTSLQLDPSTIGANLAKTGLDANNTEPGQVASLTSTNNFINFCAGKSIMNGNQAPNGELFCNPVPMGDIPAKTSMIGSKFESPTNFATIKSNTSFDVIMAINNFETGNFVNPKTNYFAAPQQLNSQGQIIGHSHFVIERVASFTDTTLTDPTKFQFFQGVNAPAEFGKLSVPVFNGLPAGTYRIASINTAANHQPALVPVAQHGSLDDMIYINIVD